MSGTDGICKTYNIPLKRKDIKVCKWEDHGRYDTACGEHYYLSHGALKRKQSPIKYCPACGGRIVEKDGDA